MLTPARLFGSILLGAIGLAAFVYGKKAAKLKPLFLGLLLMIYPCFVTETWMLYALGGVLTVALCVGGEAGNGVLRVGLGMKPHTACEDSFGCAFATGECAGYASLSRQVDTFQLLLHHRHALLPSAAAQSA